MARLPTVTLVHPTGKTRIVNQFDYAADLSLWHAKGYRRQTESRGDASAAEVAFHAEQAAIERERRVTREQPKDFEARRGEVRAPVAPSRRGKRGAAEDIAETAAKLNQALGGDAGKEPAPSES